MSTNKPQPYILLVDDDEDDLELLSASLESSDVKVITLNSGDKALSYLNLPASDGELPSLIILDYNMPGINGQQILISIKSNSNTKDIPVVIYSTSMSPYVKDSLIDHGAVNCFSKPFTYLDFTAQVGIFKDLAYSFKTKKKALAEGA